MLVTKQLLTSIVFVPYCYSFQLLDDKYIDSQSDCKEYAFIQEVFTWEISIECAHVVSI